MKANTIKHDGHRGLAALAAAVAGIAAVAGGAIGYEKLADVYYGQ